LIADPVAWLPFGEIPAGIFPVCVCEVFLDRSPKKINKISQDRWSAEYKDFMPDSAEGDYTNPDSSTITPACTGK
jgi:hypothetical protein